MSDDNMIDEDGNIYEKGWNGEYRPKEGFFGTEQDKDFFGSPNIKQNFLGYPEEEKDFWGNSTTANNGKKLYRRSNTSNNDNSNSSSGGGGGFEIIFFLFAIAMTLIGVAIITTPIIAPILLATVEKEKRKGNKEYVAKWETWSSIAGVIAVIVVLSTAGAIGFWVVTNIFGLTVNSTSSTLTSFIHISGVIIGIVSFALIFVTGISPTALVYLKNKEREMLSTGKIANINRITHYTSVIKTIAISTVVLTGLIFIAIPLFTTTANWVYSKAKSLNTSPVVVQTEYVVISSTNSPFMSTEVQSPTQEKTLVAPTLTPTIQWINLTGTWDLEFSYYGYTDSSGNFTNRSANENWSINLQQSGGTITGKILSVNSNYTDSCVNAIIEGTVNKSEFSLLVYFHGSCCPNEIVRIDGVIENENNIIGNYQPDKIPSGSCTLSTGDMIGVKQ